VEDKERQLLQVFGRMHPGHDGMDLCNDIVVITNIINNTNTKRVIHLYEREYLNYCNNVFIERFYHSSS
jgi:hypothetical protein